MHTFRYANIADADADDIGAIYNQGIAETGVCITQFAADVAAEQTSDRTAVEVASSCCGGSPKIDILACCVKDELAKTVGNAGCGCGDRSRVPRTSEGAHA